MSSFSSFFVDALIMILGWYVVHSLGVRRELEKEKRSAAVDTIGKLEELEEKAKSYHMSQERICSMEREVKRDIKIVIRRLNRLGMGNTIEQRKRILKMRQSVTCDNFESDSFIPRKENDPQISKISLAIDTLVMELEKSLYYKPAKHLKDYYRFVVSLLSTRK